MIRVRPISRMDPPTGNPSLPPPPSSSNPNRYSLPSPSNFIHAPLSLLLEHLGILRSTNTRPNGNNSHDSEGLISNSNRLSSGFGDVVVPNDGEVSISIIGEHNNGNGNRIEHNNEGEREGLGLSNEVSIPAVGGQAISVENGVVEEGVSQSVNGGGGGGGGGDAEAGGGGSGGGDSNGRDSSSSTSSQRYDIQQAARWIEQVLPFSLLLLVVFIRQHLQGFFVTIWVTAILFKSNDILRKQTALKGERKVPVLIAISIAFTLHVVGVYWWCQNNDMLYPLVMLPPKVIPPFWHVIFIITVNDALVRQAGMVFKCILLMYYKNGRGRNYRKQGQMLTLVEYLLLLYRALLPTPVWYRFFLNKEYGSFFSSLMTGLYLTFKLTSVIEKVQSFFAAVKALSRKEVHYGAYATSEQVNAVGDLCAICQEKMHTPILLSCNHIFCEECVSEWFERERTCPLCRALVKPADLKSFGDGSTSLFFQLF